MWLRNQRRLRRLIKVEAIEHIVRSGIPGCTASKVVPRLDELSSFVSHVFFFLFPIPLGSKHERPCDPNVHRCATMRQKRQTRKIVVSPNLNLASEEYCWLFRKGTWPFGKAEGGVIGSGRAREVSRCQEKFYKLLT